MLNIKKIRRIRKAQTGLSFPIFNLLPFDLQMLQAIFRLKNSSLDIPKPLPTNTESSLTYPKIQNDTNIKLFNYPNYSAMNNAGLIADFSRRILFNNNNSQPTSNINAGYDTLASSLMGFSPVGTIAGGAMKVGAFVGDGLASMGFKTDLMTTTDLILDSNFMKLSPIGLVNTFGASKTLNFSKDLNMLDTIGGSYMGTSNNLDRAQNLANKTYGLFSQNSKKSANRFISKMKQLQGTMLLIAKNAEDLLALSLLDNNSIQYLNTLNGGYDINHRLYAKEGGLLEMNIDLEDSWKPVINKKFTPVITLKKGGTLKSPEIEETALKNIIPEGALHKNKHHMENADSITKKGIPVVDDNGELQAEIELNEIIFTLEVTKKLEELYNKYFDYEYSQKEKDLVAIEAGLLLVKEILFNTDDRTGLIDTLKLGGKINGFK